ncbi:MAG TPA: hypothetical protein PLC04_08200 [Candidatus Kapabacteria bacterium]|nr:hypothetical protein [Candidatus Kapabacteria bacterium]HOV93041.1 hypothetical protein [Candidatus Kapabacteria bacterium]
MKTLNIYYILIILLVFANIDCSNAQISENLRNDFAYNFKISEQKQDKNDNSALKVLIAGIEIGKNLADLNPSKVEAAFTLAMYSARFFDVVPPLMADSISRSLKLEGKDNSLLSIARYFSCDFIAYININRVVNIMRTDITILSGKDFQNKNTGTGYAFINYRDSVSNEFFYDPSILLSIQRAFALAVKNYNLYAHLANPVYPAPPLVITGIEFKDDPEIKPQWSLFANSVVNSYYILELIFKNASKNNRFTVFDFPTRDSIYSQFNFYAPENYKAPNQMELYALRQFEIEYYITGTFARDTNGAVLTLILVKFTSSGLSEVKQVSANITEDSKTHLEAILEKVVSQLLSQ